MIVKNIVLTILPKFVYSYCIFRRLMLFVVVLVMGSAWLTFLLFILLRLIIFIRWGNLRQGCGPLRQLGALHKLNSLRAFQNIMEELIATLFVV